jgi:hypothetical protein
VLKAQPKVDDIHAAWLLRDIPPIPEGPNDVNIARISGEEPLGFVHVEYKALANYPDTAIRELLICLKSDTC